MRAQVLRKIDTGEHGPAWTDARAAEAFDVHVNTVRTIRKQLVLHGFAAILDRKPRGAPARTPVFDRADGKRPCWPSPPATPPPGHARWTLRLLADEVVRLDIVESVCHETIRQVLEKNPSTRIVR